MNGLSNHSTPQMNYEMQRYGTWDDAATPIPDFPVPETLTPEIPVIEPVIDPNGWHWYPDANGQLFTLYFDADANECMMWRLQDDGSYYWRCANVGYMCRDIGIEDRRGIFFENHLVGTMLLDEHLTVTWLPETYINNHPNINDINYNINNETNWLNNVNFNADIIDLSEDDYDP
jgi:hypothetical protein